MSLTDDSLIEWAASWVPDVPAGQRDRFAVALRAELESRIAGFGFNRCDVKHKFRPDAKCSLSRGHARNHDWTRVVGCTHPAWHHEPAECTACGVYQQHATPTGGEADGSQ